MITNVTETIGALHIAGFIFRAVYGIIPVQFIAYIEYIDYVYLIIFPILPISWYLCKGECVISYIVKKLEDPNYVLGTSVESTDMLIFFTNQDDYYLFLSVGSLFYIYSIIIVNERIGCIIPKEHLYH